MPPLALPPLRRGQVPLLPMPAGAHDQDHRMSKLDVETWRRRHSPPLRLSRFSSFKTITQRYINGRKSPNGSLNQEL